MTHRPGYRRVPMTRQMMEILRHQEERFRSKFGRDPRPEDPVFFDENADEPQPMPMDDMEREITEFLIAVNIPPEMIHAFKVTGRLVTEDNIHHLSEDEIKEWADAVEEYRRLHPAS